MQNLLNPIKDFRIWMEQNFKISISPHEFDFRYFTNTCFYHKLFNSKEARLF